MRNAECGIERYNIPDAKILKLGIFNPLDFTIRMLK